MSAWSNDELTKIGTAEELRIESLRSDGSLRKPVIVWMVRHGDDIYVRAVRGTSSGWYRGTQEIGEGHIQAAGVSKDISFVIPDRGIDDEIDAEYRRKYRRYAASIVGSTVTPEARSATLKLMPR